MLQERDRSIDFENDASRAQVEIARLCAEYLDRTDHPDGAPVAELFTEAGVLVLGTLELRGRERIARFFDERNVGQAASRRLTRHIAGAPLVKSAANGTATARSSAIVFAGAGELPLKVTEPSTICDFVDQCTVDESGCWRFAHRRADVIITGAGAADFARATA